MNCANCGVHVYARGRCRNCYQYLMRHGVERPEEVRLMTARRRLDRELTLQAWGFYLATQPWITGL